MLAQYTALVSLVAPASVPRVVANDADDDHVIAAAVAARAELIVTGDRKHLLPIGSHQGIAIVTAHEALDRIEATRKTRPNTVRLSTKRGITRIWTVRLPAKAHRRNAMKINSLRARHSDSRREAQPKGLLIPSSNRTVLRPDPRPPPRQGAGQAKALYEANSSASQRWASIWSRKSNS